LRLFLSSIATCLLLSLALCSAQEPEKIRQDESVSTGGSEHFPPIDCPLRKQGIDPHNLKPFGEVKKYIDFLEREDRALWQKPDLVVEELRLNGSETVADIGAGSGYFSFRLAGALPRGHVIAIDIEPEMIRYIHHESVRKGITNIEAQLVKPEDPEVPPSADVVFVCDVLHHVDNRKEWLSKLFEEMKTGSRLILIEFKEGKLPEGPPEHLKIPEEMMISTVTAAGFQKTGATGDLLPYQYFLELRKP